MKALGLLLGMAIGAGLMACCEQATTAAPLPAGDNGQALGGPSPYWYVTQLEGGEKIHTEGELIALEFEALGGDTLRITGIKFCRNGLIGWQRIPSRVVSIRTQSDF